MVQLNIRKEELLNELSAPTKSIPPREEPRSATLNNDLSLPALHKIRSSGPPDSDRLSKCSEWEQIDQLLRQMRRLPSNGVS